MAFAVQPACHQMNRLSAILPVSQVLVDVDATLALVVLVW